MENAPQNKIEQEIAELSKMIEQKRNQLEASYGIVEEREMVKSSVAEKLSETSAVFAQGLQKQGGTGSTSPNVVSYLDSLNEEDVERVNKYIEIAFTKGVEKAMKSVEIESPAIIDAFHDALTDKFYEELKNRGIIKEK